MAACAQGSAALLLVSREGSGMSYIAAMLVAGLVLVGM